MKRSLVTYFSFLIYAFLATACEEPYEPELESSDQEIIVVEGSLSDSSLIRLSESTPLNDNGYRPVEGAQVRAETKNGGGSMIFTEVEAGLYYSAELPQAGAEYRLNISTQNLEIQSDWVEVMAAQPIDTIYYSIESGFLRLYLDSRSDGPSGYYQWDFEETWEYNSRFYSSLIYREDGIDSRNADERIFICYKTVKNSQILIGSTVDLAENKISRQLIHEIDPMQSMRLKVDYSIKVTQRRISAEAFEFWRLLKGNTESMGSLFDAQPSNLPSNLRVLNRNRPIIGFFSAALPSEKRIFIRRIDLPFTDYYNPYSYCQLDTVPTESLTVEDAFGSGDYIPVRRTPKNTYLGSARSCVDCRERGGVTEKPAFWIY